MWIQLERPRWRPTSRSELAGGGFEGRLVNQKDTDTSDDEL